MKILDLPFEILCQIVECLDDISDCFRIKRVCRIFFQVSVYVIKHSWKVNPQSHISRHFINTFTLIHDLKCNKLRLFCDKQLKSEFEKDFVHQYTKNISKLKDRSAPWDNKEFTYCLSNINDNGSYDLISVMWPKKDAPKNSTLFVQLKSKDEVPTFLMLDKNEHY